MKARLVVRSFLALAVLGTVALPACMNVKPQPTGAVAASQPSAAPATRPAAAKSTPPAAAEAATQLQAPSAAAPAAARRQNAPAAVPSPDQRPGRDESTPISSQTQPFAVKEEKRLVDEPLRRVSILSNGLTVILQKNTTAPVVACRVYIKAGSLTEQEWMGAGLSHVVEHLVAGGSSKKLEEKQSAEALKVLGGDSNAMTSYDFTCYFITTIASKWTDALNLLSDWTTGADFTDAQFAREYQVVQRELEMDEAEATRSFYTLTAANRYIVSPAGLPVIGYKPVFQKLTAADARAYYHRMYIPENMIVSVAGDIDLDKALDQAMQDFGHIPPGRVPVINLPPEPNVIAPRLTIGHADVKQARVEWAFPTVKVYSPEMYPLDVLANILGDGESSLLVQSLRDQKQLVTGIMAYDATPSYAPGQLAIDAVLDPKNIPAAKQAVMELLDNVIKNGVTQAQVEKARAQVAASLIYGNQTAEQQATRNAFDYMTTGNIDYSKIYVDNILKVTPEQVQAAARAYLDPHKLLTTVLLPLGVERSVVESSATSQPAVARSVEKFTLSNGLTVLIGRNTAAPVVTINLAVKGGLLAENEQDNGIGNAMMELLGRGTDKMSYPEIATFFDKTAGSFSTISGNNTFMITATALKNNAAKTFDVFSDIALHPAFNADEWHKIQPQLIAAIQRSTEDWSGQGYKLLRNSFFAGGPYKDLSVGKIDVVQRLTPDDLKKHYEQFFLDPRQAVLSIYGDINPAQVKQWVQRFADMPQHQVTLNSESTDAPAGTVTAHTNQHSAAVFIGYGPGMTVTDPDRYPMIVLRTILAGYNSPGGSILHETLRGKGLVYVVQGFNFMGPAKGVFVILALGEPPKAGAIVSNIDGIVADMKAGKFTDDQLKTAKDQAITGEQLEDQTIAAQAQQETLDELLGLGYNVREEFASKISAVTRDDVVRVAKQYLQHPVVTIATPLAPASRPAASAATSSTAPEKP